MKPGAQKQVQVIASLAEYSGLKNNHVEGFVDALFGVASTNIKTNGNFKLAGMSNLKLKKKAATTAKKGINPCTKNLCVSKVRSASEAVRAHAVKQWEFGLLMLLAFHGSHPYVEGKRDQL